MPWHGPIISADREVSLSTSASSITFEPGSGWDEDELVLTNIIARMGAADLSQANICTALAEEGKEYLAIVYLISDAFGLWITTAAENLSAENVGSRLSILEGDGYLVITSYEDNTISGYFNLGTPTLDSCVNPSEGSFTGLVISEGNIIF